jgi:hypothetical protein
MAGIIIEVGVWLVEHDQERVAVEGARQRDALGVARPTSTAPPSPILVS